MYHVLVAVQFASQGRIPTLTLEMHYDYLHCVRIIVFLDETETLFAGTLVESISLCTIHSTHITIIIDTEYAAKYRRSECWYRAGGHLVPQPEPYAFMKRAYHPEILK